MPPPTPNDPVQRYLKPGELCCTDQPLRVTTVLGSCISVTFFHRPTRLAAICHALHPQCPHPTQCPPNCGLRYRYVACALETMERWMQRRDVRPSQIEAKLFGGAALMGQQGAEKVARSVGALNVHAARQTLVHFGVALQAVDVGGTRGRKIVYDTATGAVWLKRLEKAQSVNGSDMDAAIALPFGTDRFRH